MSKRQKYYSLRSFLAYMSNYKLRMTIVLVSFVISDILVAIIPVFIGQLIGALTESPADKSAAYMFVTLLIVCSTGTDIFWRISEILYARLLQPAVIAYENHLFKHTIRQPYPYFVDKFTGKLSSYVTMISYESKEFIEKVYWDYTEQIVSLVTVGVVLTAINPQTGLVFAVNLLLMAIVGKFTIKNSLKYEKKWTDVQSTKNGKIIDAISNFMNVKSFRKERAEIDLISREQQLNIRAANKAFYWSIFFWASMSFFIRNTIWASAILLNVSLYLNGQLTIAELTTILSALLLFSSFIWDLVWNISQFSLRFTRMEEAYRYLFGTVNIMKIADKTTAKSPPLLTTSLALQNLSFAYPDKADTDVLSDISLTIKKGEKVGIVGKSGSGKTTLTKLLLGYYDVNNTMTLLDGQPTHTNVIAQLVSYVPQDTSLFHRTIAENIAYAAEQTASRDDVVAAARRAHADEFISKIEHGYDALVGERGVKLSAGQRQRIAIARAYLDDKPILILDEATSALDSESEVLVQQALESLWQDKTVIAIAHRLSTLRNMDRIIVMEKGTIVESGTHQNLLSQNGTYAKLWSHQSGGFIED